MDKAKEWAVYYDNNKYPCFITDKDTVELLYCNNEFLKLFDKTMDIIGSNANDIVKLKENYMEEALPDWNTQTYYETNSHNGKTNIRFLTKAILNKADGTVFCTIIPTEDHSQINKDFEEALTQCIEIYDSKDTDIMQEFSKLLANFYDSELAYVYRFDKDNANIKCISHWAAPDFKPTQNKSGTTKLGMGAIIEWFQENNTPTIIIANTENNSEIIHPTLQDIISTFEVRNVVFCKVEDGKGNFIGMVGVTNRRDCTKLFDKRLLLTISRFVAQEVSNVLVDATLLNLQNRDALTGVYNRDGYSLRTSKMLDENLKTVGIVAMNINGLKAINENDGVSGGDNHIKKSVKMAKKYFGFEFFRMSGDEFIGIAPNIEHDLFNEKVTNLSDLMRTEENYDFSFGHAFGKGSIDLAKLTYEAETVMYINKQEYYSSTKRNFDTVRDSILADLLSFLANDEFMIYLQPQVKLKDGSLYGAEALIRRFDKTNNKMVFPDQFIPQYEQKSIIRHIDIFVVKTVCRLLSEWAKENKAIPISVNLSRVTLQEYGIVDTIVEICDKYNVPHNLLVIEVTERVGLIENNVASALITSFKSNGFNISLDDFGCAYSNIVTLAQIEVDEVKIDKSLVDDLTTNDKNHILVKNVLSMCNELEGASTLAEGIEYQEQATLLHELGCSLGQGYFYSRPIPVDEFEKKYIKV